MSHLCMPSAIPSGHAISALMLTMTIGGLLTMYLHNHLYGKPSYNYYNRLLRDVFPPLVAFHIHDLPKLEWLNWWAGLRDRPSHANKAIGFYRAAHRWAMANGLLDFQDPTAGIKKHPERTRAITTSPDEWARIVPFLEDLKLRRRIAYWACYLLGNRGGEIRTMETAHLFLDRSPAVWVRPTSKNRKPYVKPIPVELVPMLKLVIATNPPGTRYVFWGNHPTRPFGRTSMQKQWQQIRAKAGLPHLWLNDLRRSTASDLLNQGENLGVVQAALNHRSLSQTAKYAYLAVKPLSTALQKRTEEILHILDANTH